MFTAETIRARRRQRELDEELESLWREWRAMDERLSSTETTVAQLETDVQLHEERLDRADEL